MPRRPADLNTNPRDAQLHMATSREFHQWLARFASSRRMPVSIAVETAIVEHARQVGYPEPAPSR